MKKLSLVPRILCLPLLGVVLSGNLSAAELLPPGHRPLPLGVHALVNGKVVVRPGEVLEGATVVIRDGLIEAVGKDVAAPADARVWEMKGLIIHAGLIDPYLMLGSPRVVRASRSDFALTSGINFFGVPGGERDPGGPGPGYEVGNITPDFRVAQSFAPDIKALEKLREIGFTAGNVIPEKGIVRGSSAFVSLGEVSPNRAIIRADVFQHVGFDNEGGGDSAYPGSLMGIIAAVRQTFFDAHHYALDHAHYRGARPGDRTPPPFNTALGALVPAAEKKMPVVFEPGSALMVDRAAHVGRELGLDFLIVSSGQEWRRPDLARATGAPFIVPVNFPEIPKMPGDDDWADVSLDQLRAWDWAPENPALLRQNGLEIALTTHALAERGAFRKNLRAALERGLSEDDALAALTTVPARLCGVEKLLGTIEPGKLAHLTVVEGKSWFDSEAKVREVWIDGRHYRVPDKKESKDARSEDKDKPEKEKKDEKKDKEPLKRVARLPAEGRGPIASPAAVLIENATIWTSARAGVLTNATLLARHGKIERIGRFNVPRNADLHVIDAQGKHVTPGLIDAHSHAMILGAVNESTLPSTAMVRIGDVVNSETDNIHKQLAGGLTVANLLHGSANPIGGQNAVIKLREGAGPEELKFDIAPPGIKFALGENVKQSNWGDRKTTRFPQSRMGVQTFIANRFIAAQRYLQEWDQFRSSGGAPPRRDLELETLGEIIQGRRWIHCHSYRQDEILMLLRLMEKFGVTIGTLQHVLEGYKVADEIAAHGAGASAFADWWAYKFEVYDAIPHAGSLMNQRGVLVSFNSDSPDLARRMNTEAAKAVKFGGASEIDALKFVTINPARQLRIDGRVGSLEPGKDADFVIWSKAPLDSTAVCLETWIEGKKYFDIQQVDGRAEALQQERKELLEKARKGAKGSDASGEKGSEAARAAFFERALETARDQHVWGCLDCDSSFKP